MDEHERELRRLRLEARAQQADVEIAEAELESSTTQLGDVLRDWAAQGQIVRLDAVDRPRTGRLFHVGNSVVTLLNSEGIRELVVLDQLEGCTALGAKDDTVAVWTSGPPHSLVAHLRGCVGVSGAVMIERRGTDPVWGQVVGVAETHLTMRIATGEMTVIPLGAIVAVVARS